MINLSVWLYITEVLKYRKNLDAYIKRFNEVSFWVGTVICDISTYKERGMMIEKFIEVAKVRSDVVFKSYMVHIPTLISLALL